MDDHAARGPTLHHETVFAATASWPNHVNCCLRMQARPRVETLGLLQRTGPLSTSDMPVSAKLCRPGAHRWGVAHMALGQFLQQRLSGQGGTPRLPAPVSARAAKGGTLRLPRRRCCSGSMTPTGPPLSDALAPAGRRAVAMFTPSGWMQLRHTVLLESELLQSWSPTCSRTAAAPLLQWC